MKIKTLALILFCKISLVHARGGSVIGNGAGVVENNFQFAYTSLKMTISECLMMMNCEMSTSENKILKKITQTIQKNTSNPNRLVFISAAQRPGFFDTTRSEKHRVAKTGLTPDYPIYVNTEALYTADGQPALGYSTIVSILSHELGHQSGEKSHSKLDIIGSKLKSAVMRNTKTHAVQLGRDQKVIEVMIIQLHQPEMTSEVFVSWQGVGSMMLTENLAKAVFCHHFDGAEKIDEIDNGHFTSLSEVDQAGTASFGFGAWVHYSCGDGKKRAYVELLVTEDLKVSVLQVREF